MTKTLLDAIKDNTHLKTVGNYTIRDEVFGSHMRFCWNPNCQYMVPITRSFCLKCNWTAKGPLHATSSILGTVVKARGKTAPRPRGMNKTEARYSAYLEKEKAAGRISAFWFEAWKIRLSDTCTWTPDFVVIDCDGMIEWRDVKAWWSKAQKVGIEEDSLVKMKTAAEMYPQFKVLATWERDGVWEQRVF